MSSSSKLLAKLINGQRQQYEKLFQLKRSSPRGMAASPEVTQQVVRQSQLNHVIRDIRAALEVGDMAKAQAMAKKALSTFAADGAAQYLPSELGGTLKEGMFGSSKLIRPGDVEALVHWLDEPRNHRAAVDAVSFAPDAHKDKAFIDFIVSSPEFQGWDPAMVSHAVDKANELDLMEGEVDGPHEGLMESKKKIMLEAMDIRRSDEKALLSWIQTLPSEAHLQMAKAMNRGGLSGLAKLLKSGSFPALRHWNVQDVLYALENVGEHNLGFLLGNLTESEMKKVQLEALVASAVKKGMASALKESAPKSKTVQITRTQLAEGVRKAVKLTLKENAPLARAGSGTMAGGAMSPPGAGAGQQMSAPTQEGVSSGEGPVRGRSSFGQLPAPEELQKALDDEGGWSMTLRGEDERSFENAVNAAGMDWSEAEGMMSTGEGMHRVLTALLDAGAQGDENAESLASSIMDVLGWEWI